MDITNDKLIEFLELSETITKSFVDNSQYGFNLDLDSFMLRVYNLNPQRYGFRLQSYFTLMMGYETIPSTADLGDFRNLEGEAAELKCSFITQTNNVINVKQIRIWQQTKYYYVLACNFNDFRNLSYECFKLSKREMQEEMILCNAGASHSTKKRNEENINVEMSLTVKLGTDTYKRWVDNYKLNNFDFRAICSNRVKEKNYKEQLEKTIQELETRLAIASQQEEEELNKQVTQLELFACEAAVEERQAPRKEEKIEWINPLKEFDEKLKEQAKKAPSFKKLSDSLLPSKSEYLQEIIDSIAIEETKVFRFIGESLGKTEFTPEWQEFITQNIEKEKVIEPPKKKRLFGASRV